MLKHSMVDEIKYAKKEMDEVKKGFAENGEKKVATEDDLDVIRQHLKDFVKHA